jgi:hypothetical protein
MNRYPELAAETVKVSSIYQVRESFTSTCAKNTRFYRRYSFADANLVQCFVHFVPHQENKLSSLSDEEIIQCELPAKEPPCSPLGETDSFLWLDVTDPTPEEVTHLAGRFGLDPQILEDINSFEGRPKLHDYEDYITSSFTTLN